MGKQIIKELRFSVTNIEDYRLLSQEDDNKKLIFDEFVNIVSKKVNTRVKDVTIFNVFSTDRSLTVERKDWKTVLESAIEFYSSIEDFDSCIKCKQLIEKI